MKKLIAASVGAALLIPGTATSAFAYPVTTPTDTSTQAPNKAKIGEKIRVKVKANTNGDAGAICTGEFVLIIKNNRGEVVKQSRKPADDVKNFRFKLRSAGKYRLAVKYQRGQDDPCGKSRSGQDLRIQKRSN
ncbi:hypothetical protein I601_1751 [Nocardioides dokdonensis FR1436]|uniref:Uncharacterized protein n=1 Tax=Nocardioides dokdonensis FR1436 TaxID=1300347 RepID=A0A1A9GKK8_9ACTN|nr:hypothetical protein [Nocardioides dokdonensis]ANH38182.1 hypothetical protein I601_1751 [Nocardioides dokdonensis FR1436]